ncbi:hypothetical protein K9M79_02895 [Candidatus Woesearchaeota archaeon]|nr:hypothetical protein [Candidatus Woesearchaeota archaeon]
METKKITQKELKKRAQFFAATEVYKPLTMLRKITAYGLIGAGAITLPLPTGSIIAIGVGCAMLGIDPKKLLNTIKFYGKKVADWIYGNRNWKLIKRNLKLRFLR